VTAVPDDRRPRFRRRFLILWLAGVVSVALVLPYALTLEANVLQQLPVPIAVVALAGLVQSSVLLAIAVFVGLRAADAVGLRTPLTNALAARANVRATFMALGPASAAAIGIATAAVIVGLDVLVFRPLMPEFGAAVTVVSPSRWLGLIASFYGGIGEELLTRLFLVSVIAWILRGRAIWLAIVIAAVLFAAGHLPAVVTVSPLTPTLVARTLLLNAIAGIAFGWLYWRRGLEAAMVAHFSADLVLHVVVGG
jgi:membrane protease YdiL (CAAX protease family)